MNRQICWAKWEAGAHRLFADWMGSVLLLLCTMKQWCVVQPPFFPSLVPQLHPKGWILLSQYSLFQLMALPSWAFQTGGWGMSSSLLCPSSLHPDDGPVYKHFSVTVCPFVPVSWVLLKQIILFHPEVSVPSRRQLSFKFIPFYTLYENGHPMAAIQKSTSIKCWRGCGEKGTLLHCWWECKLVQPLWRTVWRFLEKLEIELPYDPAIPLLGIHTEETRSERDTCSPLFIAALFIIARTWKQPRSPSADKWIRKLWYIYPMECYSAIKKNSFESVLMRWMKLEPIIQSEVSQKDKDQ